MAVELDRAADLLEREMRKAWNSWKVFAVTRSAEDWREYCASYRRARMVVANLDIHFRMPKPILRVKAYSVLAA